MNRGTQQCEIIVVGAGPAGMAAAVRAAQSGRAVTVVDDNTEAGGQIWRKQGTAAGAARIWFARFDSLPIQLLSGAQVISADSRNRTLRIETESTASDFAYKTLILATGAREFFLPFPGWTLPNVIGAGGLQALAKSGLPLAEKRVVVAGSGPLLLATASYFRAHGAVVKSIAEQASWRCLLAFGLRMLRRPSNLAQALRLRFSLSRIPYRTSCWIEAAEGTSRLRSVQLRRGNHRWEEKCDYLATSYGLIPNLELAQLLGCELQGLGTDRAIRVDQLQRTSDNYIFAAGECTGIGGVEKSLLEGEIAGFAAAGAESTAKHLSSGKLRADKFARDLKSTFALRPEVRALAQADTLICRCEDVPLEALKNSHSWRSAKLHHRCGMGPCQGRICGPIVETLFGWSPTSVRAPIFPARVASLTHQGEHKAV